MEELANFDVSEFHARRIDAKEIMTPSVGIFHLPNRRWNEKFLEEVRESENPLQGGTKLQGVKISEKTFRETLRSLNQDAEARNDFGQLKEISFIRHFFEPGVQLCVPKERHSQYH